MRRAFGADTQGPGLSNPAMQPKFMPSYVPNALDPGFIYQTPENRPDQQDQGRKSASRCR